MANVLVENNSIQDVADAIREKTDLEKAMLSKLNKIVNSSRIYKSVEEMNAEVVKQEGDYAIVYGTTTEHIEINKVYPTTNLVFLDKVVIPISDTTAFDSFTFGTPYVDFSNYSFMCEGAAADSSRFLIPLETYIDGETKYYDVEYESDYILNPPTSYTYTKKYGPSNFKFDTEVEFTVDTRAFDPEEVFRMVNYFMRYVNEVYGGIYRVNSNLQFEKVESLTVGDKTFDLADYEETIIKMISGEIVIEEDLMKAREMAERIYNLKKHAVGDVKLFKSIEEMNADPDKHYHDLAVVYDKPSLEPLAVGDVFSRLNLVDTPNGHYIELDEAFNTNFRVDISLATSEYDLAYIVHTVHDSADIQIESDYYSGMLQITSNNLRIVYGRGNSRIGVGDNVYELVKIEILQTETEYINVYKATWLKNAVPYIHYSGTSSAGKPLVHIDLDAVLGKSYSSGFNESILKFLSNFILIDKKGFLGLYECGEILTYEKVNSFVYNDINALTYKSTHLSNVINALESEKFMTENDVLTSKEFSLRMLIYNFFLDRVYLDDNVKQFKDLNWVSGDGYSFPTIYANGLTNVERMFMNRATKVEYIDLSHIKADNITDISLMFYRCTALKELDYSFFNRLDKSKLVKANGTFTYCNELTEIDASFLDETTALTQLSGLFNGSSSLEKITSKSGKIHLPSGINMASMFYGCSKLESIPKIVLKHPTTIADMFRGCRVLEEIDTSDWEIDSSLTSLSSAFYMCRKLKFLDVSRWNTSGVNELNSVFSECENLIGLDVSNWNTDLVTSTRMLFHNCGALTSLDLTNWNLSNVKNAEYMFYNCKNLEHLGEIEWNLENLESAEHMFRSCRKLTSNELDVGIFNACTKVKSFVYTFYGCLSITSLDMSGVNMLSAIDIRSMFSSCSNLVNLNVSTWNLANVTTISSLVFDCPSLSNESLNGILAAISTVEALADSNRTLRHIGLLANQAATCKTLSNWAAAEAKGWITGYADLDN